MDSPANKVIWQIKDGKRGHENQSGGLIQALSKHLPVQTFEIDVREMGISWFEFMSGRGGQFPKLQKPDVIIGAGSQTHSTILAVGRATKTPTIVMMAPPRGISALFDLCIVPEHDGRSGSNIVTTKGVVNPVEISTEKDATKGLFLVGGPSKHHNWDESGLLRQIEQILCHDTETDWTLTTSRRTPPGTATRLVALEHPRCEIVPVEKTDSDWLPARLAKSSQVWVTEDSVSMIYEALSSGAKVGVLPVPRKSGNSRVIRGVDQLVVEGQLLAYQENQCDLPTFDAPASLNEAARVAQIIADRFLKGS